MNLLAPINKAIAALPLIFGQAPQLRQSSMAKATNA
jgi:hypothetical protein